MQQTPLDQNREVTSASQWKSKTSEGAPLELPSGNVARVRRVSIQTYMKTGRIPNVLMAPVQKALQTGGDSVDDTDLKKIMQDPKALNEMFGLVDMITIDALVEPKVHPEPFKVNNSGNVIRDEQGNPIPDARDEALLYVDEVDLTDKMFIFQWMVGGTSDLEQFRSQQEQQLGAVQSS